MGRYSSVAVMAREEKKGDGGIGSHALRYWDKKEKEEEEEEGEEEVVEEGGASYNRTSSSTTNSPILFFKQRSNSYATEEITSHTIYMYHEIINSALCQNFGHFAMLLKQFISVNSPLELNRTVQTILLRFFCGASQLKVKKSPRYYYYYYYYYTAHDISHWYPTHLTNAA